MKKTGLFFIILILCCAIASAANYPGLTGYVNDFAQIMTPDEEANLTNTLTFLEANTTVEIAIVTVPDTDSQDRVTYAARLGEQAGVGKAATDNGVVVLYSLSNEKGGAIATGRGIESTLNDAKVSRIGRAHKASFDEGRYYDGFSGIITDISAELMPADKTALETLSGLSVWAKVIIIICVLLLLLIIIGIAANSDSGSGGGSWGGAGYIGSSNSWSSSSGSSFGGFGGGSFGGGGGSF